MKYVTARSVLARRKQAERAFVRRVYLELTRSYWRRFFSRIIGLRRRYIQPWGWGWSRQVFNGWRKHR